MTHIQHLDKEGMKLPSVSQIPGIFAKDMAGFEDWICKGLHNRVDRCCIAAKREFYAESANLGNDIHVLREAFLKGETFEEGVPEYQAALFDPVAKFYTESGYKPLQIETSEGNLCGIELKMTGKKFGGTLDGAGTFSVPFWEKQRKTFWDHSAYPENDEWILMPAKDSIWIEDLKIKSKLDVLHPLQLYGYRLLLQELHGVTADWGLIIRREKKLDKTPQIQLKGYYLPAYKEQWDAAMLMYHFLND